MGALDKYKCIKCGEIHNDWPALTYKAPLFYDVSSNEDKENIAFLNDDFCEIEGQDTTDLFIRCTLTQTVNDHCENLEYGLWVSLSGKSFKDYKDNYDNENHEVSYFGWLSNDISDYAETTAVPTTVYTKKGNSRPEIVPHEDFDHPFVKDYYSGISKKEAEERIARMIELTSE